VSVLLAVNEEAGSGAGTCGVKNEPPAASSQATSSPAPAAVVNSSTFNLRLETIRSGSSMATSCAPSLPLSLEDARPRRRGARSPPL